MFEFKNHDYADLIALDKGQGDPLDLASTNERLYNTVFPGYNNTVRYIRVYSAMCWMAWQVEKSFHKNPAGSMKKAGELQLQALQKMELVLLWANEGNTRGVAGNSREFPSDNKSQLLLFSEWDIVATLLAPVQYGPSITNGLKFLYSNWVCTPAGETLAKAFEAGMGESAQYQWLSDIKDLTTTRKKVMALRAALDLSKPSREEKMAFLASFFPKKQGHAHEPLDKKRWCGVHLTLHAIHTAPNGAATESVIRASMARGVTSNGTQVVRDGLEPIQATWAILQLRQLQRWASETLFSVVMSWVGKNRATGRGINECVSNLCAAALPTYTKQKLLTVGQLEQFFHSLQGEHATLYVAAAKAPGGSSDLFSYFQKVGVHKSLIWTTDGCTAVAEALDALVFCAVETANLQQLKHHGKVLQILAHERSSLTALAQSLARFRDQPIKRWIEHILIEWVFARSFEVAIHRSKGLHGKLRFDFTQDEFGLQLGGPRASPFGPSIARDKLTHTLLLCEQSGLIKSCVQQGEDAFTLTALGQRRVETFDADK